MVLNLHAQIQFNVIFITSPTNNIIYQDGKLLRYGWQLSILFFRQTFS